MRCFGAHALLGSMLAQDLRVPPRAGGMKGYPSMPDARWPPHGPLANTPPPCALFRLHSRAVAISRLQLPVSLKEVSDGVAFHLETWA